MKDIIHVDLKWEAKTITYYHDAQIILFWQIMKMAVIFGTVMAAPFLSSVIPQQIFHSINFTATCNKLTLLLEHFHGLTAIKLH